MFAVFHNENLLFIHETEEFCKCVVDKHNGNKILIDFNNEINKLVRVKDQAISVFRFRLKSAGRVEHDTFYFINYCQAKDTIARRIKYLENKREEFLNKHRNYDVRSIDYKFLCSSEKYGTLSYKKLDTFVEFQNTTEIG